MTFNRQRIVNLILFPLFFLIMAAFIVYFRKPLWDLFSSPEAIHARLHSLGYKAPLIFIALQILQVVVFFIPGEVTQIAGGYLFGILPGMLYSLVGISIGAGINFFIARKFGRGFIEAVAGKRRLLGLDQFTGRSRVTTAYFLLFLIPGIPKDILCYLAGISRIRFTVFFLISSAGRLPALTGSVIMGDAASGQNWVLTGILLGLAVLFFLVGSLYQKKIERFISTRFVENSPGSEGEGENGSGNI